jgi:hypothetical protein
MSTRRHNLIAAFLTLATVLGAGVAGAQADPTLDCGNAFYDDGTSTGFSWFGGGHAGEHSKMFAVRFDLADFGYEPGYVEITGFCAGNLLSVGGLFANDVYLYPDNEGVPDDSVVLAVGRILTGNGTGASEVVFDKPVTLHGDFWLVNRGTAALATTDFNMEHDAEPDGEHSFVSETGIDGLEAATDGDYVLRASLRPTDRSYLAGGMARQPGANDTLWRSKLAVLNPGDRPVLATARLLATDGTSLESDGTLAPGELLAWDDVLGELFEVSEPVSGSILVHGDGPLVVTARTYNESDSGTLGQYLPGVGTDQTMTGGDVGILSPLSNNQQFRTNVGFINLGDRACRISTTLFDDSGSQIGEERIRQIDPSGWKQDNDIFALTGAGSHDNAYAVIQVLTDGCAAWAYASVIDNATGDPTTIPVVVQ